MASSCEHDNEPLDSVRDREFLEQVSVRLASQEVLHSMELFNLGRNYFFVNTDSYNIIKIYSLIWVSADQMKMKL
jgi:hypothetical protein